MPNFSAEVTLELEAELEFQGESLDEAINWLRETNLEGLTNLRSTKHIKGNWNKENIVIHSIKETFNDKE